MTTLSLEINFIVGVVEVSGNILSDEMGERGA